MLVSRSGGYPVLRTYFHIGRNKADGPYIPCVFKGLYMLG